VAPHDSADLPTIELLQRVQQGDLPAREALFARYRERVLAIARVRLSAGLRRHLESVDILQEALLEAVRGLERFEMRDESSLIRWLAVLVERRIAARARALRAVKRDHAEASPDAEGREPERSAPEPSPSDQAIAHEQGARVQAALAGLPERQRELILLRDYAGTSWEAIASELGLPSPDAARMLHARALVKLGAELRRS
jgi:RNA polymerase sigma-70 factor (ECF subfamily)